MPSTKDNTDGIRRFAALLDSKPLGVSSLEEAQQFLSDMGVSHRFACHIHEHEHSLQVRSAGSISTPELKAHFPGAEIPIPLNQIGEDLWAGRFVFPWEEFCLLLACDERTATVPVYGPCSAALSNHLVFDKSVPVVTLYELGAAVAEVKTGAPIRMGGSCSEVNEAIFKAKEAARILRTASKNAMNG